MAHNRTLLSGFTSEVITQVVQLSQYNLELLFNGVDEIRLTGGLLVQEFITQMQMIMNGSSTTKLRLYTAHDVTIAALLKGLSVPLTANPPYAAHVVAELHLSTENK